jgi:hypothetical protein
MQTYLAEVIIYCMENKVPEKAKNEGNFSWGYFSTNLELPTNCTSLKYRITIIN